MKKLIAVLTYAGFAFHLYGQGGIQLDNNLAAGYLDLWTSGNHYTGLFGFEVWYKNDPVSQTDPEINLLSGKDPLVAYQLLTTHGFTLGTHINPGAPGTTAQGGIVAGIGELDFPLINRIGNSDGNTLFGIAFWVGTATSFQTSPAAGVTTFNNPTSDYLSQPPPPAPSTDNWSADLIMGVPEPGALSLLILGGVVAFVRRYQD